jgi:hypothetical protein
VQEHEFRSHPWSCGLIRTRRQENRVSSTAGIIGIVMLIGSSIRQEA